MNVKQYHTAIKMATEAALKGGQSSLPEIIGVLELAKINAERLAYEQAKDHQKILRVPPPLPPGL